MTIRDIITNCGDGAEFLSGATAIARKSQDIDLADTVAIKTIYKWPVLGIPERRWSIIRALTDVTLAELHSANEAVRAAKKRNDESGAEVSAA
ncbi:MAG: hypothetical protein AAGD43_06735 [Pseudomonadota bacterium]